jgi:minor fimbrial subunit
MNRAVGNPAVLEGQFLGGENGACLIFRDQKGAEWSTDYYGYACGKSKLPPPTPDNCAVTSSENWDIAFGNLERSDISDSSSNEKTKDLTLTCTGTKAHDFSVKLNMTATSWSTSQLVTTNPDLGIAVSVGGTAAKLGESFKMKVTGSGSTTLGFSVVRNPKTKALDVATGAFTASGTLVVSED